MFRCSNAAMAAVTLIAYATDAAAQDTPNIVIDEILVTASPMNPSRFDVVQGTSVLRGEDLADALRGSIGETLADQPGMSSTFFGPYASRPVIRGFDGDRIRILFDGLGGIDASSVSPDHEVAGETAGTERIEILRGPATLLYGTSAIGGVVNIIDGRIPDALPSGGFDANVFGGYGTNAREGFVNGGADIAAGGGLVIHGDGAWRETKDYRIHGFASPEAEEEGIRGRVENSGGRTAQGTGGMSYIWENGLIGASVSHFDSNYGSPAGHAPAHEEEEGEEEEGEEEHELVRIDLRQTRVDGKGEIRNLDGPIASARFRFAYGDYKHTELEGGEVGTVFTNKGWEGRIEAVHAPLGALNGVFGVQYRDRDFSAVGDEAFVPPTNTRQVGVFVVESAELGLWRFDVGGRVEFARVNNPTGAATREFTSGAFSGAIAYEFIEDTLAGIAVSWTQRPPTAEELFSNGPHLATNQFEVGDPTLRQESAINMEATLRRRAGPVTGSVSVYRTWYDRFIFAQETGAEMDELPVFQFVENDARFFGVESEVVWQVMDNFSVDGGVDYVRATNNTTGQPLPRIQPLRYRLGADFTWQMVSARLEVQGSGGQRRTAPLETGTGAYAFLNARVALRPFEDRDIRLVVQGRNLTNSAARPHTSFIKDAAPLPGRDVRVAVQARF